MASRVDDCLRLLGLPADATVADADRAYLDLVKVWHPDRFAHDPALQVRAQERLKEINQAYAFLSTIAHAQRAVVDQQRRRVDCPTCGAALAVPVDTPQRLRCPRCGTIFDAGAPAPTSPEQSTTAPAPAAAPQASSTSSSMPRWAKVVLFVVGAAVLFRVATTSTVEQASPTAARFTPDSPTRTIDPSELDDSEPNSSAPRLCEAATERPQSGVEFGVGRRGGLGRIVIANGTDRDALAVMVDGASAAPRRAMFVRARDTATIRSIPSGTYRLRFQLGESWLVSGQFCTISGTSEFDDSFTFNETETETGVRYSAFEVTLNRVANGNATTGALPNVPLPLPGGRF